jgi:putative SOS response-associated peptidase YedK
MCGRFTLRTPTNLLVQQFLLDTAPELPLRYNIAPTQNAAVVRKTKEDPQRQLVLLQWGLIPSLAEDDHEVWLDPELEEKEPLLPLLKPYSSDEMKVSVVSTHVNNARNNDAQCIEVQRELF